MHQVCRKCGQFCPHFNKIVHTLTKLSTLSGQYEHCSRRLFTYTVYHALQVWTILSTLSDQYEHCSRRLFTLLLTCTVHVCCLPCSSSVDNFVHTLFKLSTLFSERVYCSHKILFTYLTESVDKIVHTFF
jgi:hypothetical protein